MSTAMGKRVMKLENLVGTSGLDEARRTVECLIEIGAIDKPDNVDELVRQYAAEGRTMKSILDEISGTSRGLPDLSEEEATL